MSRARLRLQLEQLRGRDHDLLRRLYDAYLEELVPFGASYRRRADGRWEYRPPGGDWGPDHLPYWLEEGPEHRVLLLRTGREVVGFAMVGLRPAFWMSPGTDACISEFYVVPTARRRGIGEAAARRLFQRWRGRWEVFEIPGNAPAIRFWRRIIESFTGGAFEEIEDRGGPVQRFTSGRPRRRATRPAPPRPGPPGGVRRPRATRTRRAAGRVQSR